METICAYIETLDGCEERVRFFQTTEACELYAIMVLHARYPDIELTGDREEDFRNLHEAMLDEPTTFVWWTCDDYPVYGSALEAREKDPEVWPDKYRR